MVANLIKNDQASTRSRQKENKTEITRTIEKVRKLDGHLDGLTAAEIYSNINTKKISRTDIKGTPVNNSIIAANPEPSPPKATIEKAEP